ncbi:hypothetical protein [Pseudoruegeria sp. HB172150]|uniref:hypothetical protein n=1 Tax=Pseudoruegeria sp. HB172150 TaxID=2721164 RepID=UPI0015530069|nr:hypothetical protein [Pseudoruegeria sp. HB172150]
MFFEEGWIPLSEVTGEVFRRLQALKSEGKIGRGQGELKSILAVTVWDMCDAATKVGVTATDGTVVSASKDLVAWADPMILSNEHVNLIAGTVGSSDLLDEHGEMADDETLRQRYGPFYTLPIVVPVNNFQSSLTFLAEEVKADISEDEELMKGARTILSMIERKELVTREIARGRVGTSLSRRRFKLAWALAATKVPDLRSPNRWLGL